VRSSHIPFLAISPFVVVAQGAARFQREAAPDFLSSLPRYLAEPRELRHHHVSPKP
jgi:hypothetical protein